MKRNSIIGILENEWFACDYVAKEDTALIVIPCKNAVDLHRILSEHENFRPIFLRTAIEQRHQALCLYSSLQKKADMLHLIAETSYNDYKNTCSNLLMDEQDFTRIENFEALNMQHRAENWEISNSNSLVRSYLKEYMQLMIKDDNLCVGAIMEAAAQMRRVTQGIGEMVTYLLYNRDILYAESGDDIFHLYYSLAVELSRKDRDIAETRKQMLAISNAMERLGIYEKKQVEKAKNCVTNAILRRMRAEGSVYPVRIAWHALWNMQDTMTRRSLLIRSCWNSIVIFRTGSHRTTMCGEFEKRLLHGSMRFTRRRSFVRQRI